VFYDDLVAALPRCALSRLSLHFRFETPTRKAALLPVARPQPPNLPLVSTSLLPQKSFF
jgi:hypothetical protein